MVYQSIKNERQIYDSIKMKRLIILSIFLLLLGQAYAQADTSFNSFQAEFETFLDSIETKHGQFLSESDSVFYDFLQSSWTSYKIMLPEQTKEVKPVRQPIIPEDSTSYELKAKKQITNSANKIQKLSADPVKINKPDTFFSRAITKRIN